MQTIGEYLQRIEDIKNREKDIFNALQAILNCDYSSITTVLRNKPRSEVLSINPFYKL